MTPDAITRLFKEAYDTFPPLEGKPTDDGLLAIQECILPLLMVIPYDQLEGIHSLMAILTEAAKYESEHGNATFVRPVRLPIYDKNIANDAMTVIRVCAEAAHKSRLDENASYEAAERGVAKFLRDVVDEIWYNDLKDAETFYTKVVASEIMALLDANSGGLHAVDMISLPTNMTQYYLQADGVGTLKDGYIRRVPLPRVPQIQSAKQIAASTSPVVCATIHRNPTHTGYLPIERIPMWSDLIESLSGLGRCIERYIPPFSPVRLM
jgi:hypothetical protein